MAPELLVVTNCVYKWSINQSAIQTPSTLTQNRDNIIEAGCYIA
jgi:hypothetical protein